jgi:hypothetical protein
LIVFAQQYCRVRLLARASFALRIVISLSPVVCMHTFMVARQAASRAELQRVLASAHAADEGIAAAIEADVARRLRELNVEGGAGDGGDGGDAIARQEQLQRRVEELRALLARLEADADRAA